MIRPISIEAVSNGWIATVGCQRVVYNKVEVLAADLMGYLNNPEQFEKDFLSTAVNSRHTNGLGVLAGHPGNGAVQTSEYTAMGIERMAYGGDPRTPPGYPDNITNASAGLGAMAETRYRDPRHPRSLSEEVNQTETAASSHYR